MRRIALLLMLSLCACGRGSEQKQLLARLDDQEKRIAELERRLATPAPLVVKQTAPPPSSFPTPMPVAAPVAAPAPTTSVPIGGVPSDDQLRMLADAKLAIRAFCANQWGSNWQELDRCERTENAALEKLQRGNVYNLPESVFDEIRGRCEERWTEQFSMQASCQQVQSDAYLNSQR